MDDTMLHLSTSYVPYFFDQTATIYFAARFMWLLFKDGVYFFGKPGDINDSWIRYTRVRR